MFDQGILIFKGLFGLGKDSLSGSEYRESITTHGGWSSICKELFGLGNRAFMIESPRSPEASGHTMKGRLFFFGKEDPQSEYNLIWINHHSH